MGLIVTLSYAQSVDGKIAVKNGESRYISNQASLRLNQEMRRDNDAVLVGIGTVLRDDPLLTCRLEESKNPVRVVLDSALRLPVDCRLVETSADVPTYVFFNFEKTNLEDRERLEKKNVRLVAVATDADDRLSLSEVLGELERAGIESLLVEGGAEIITSCINARLWDYLIIVTAGKIIGEGISAIGDIGVRSMDEIVEPVLQDVRILETEVVWTFVNDERDRSQLKTRALVFTAPGEVAVKSEVLEGPGSLYTSRLMAISPGTERHFYLGNFKRGQPADPEIDFADMEFDYPFRYGYINIVNSNTGSRFFGFLPHAEHFLLHERELIPLPDFIDDETALFIPHLETALSIIHDTKPLLGDKVLLTGAGVVGTLTARLLRESMGIDVTVFDINPAKERWFSRGGFVSDVSALRGPYDRAIEVSGNEKGLQMCIDSLRFEGVLTVASWYGEREIGVNLGGAFHRKRLVLKSSQVSHLSPRLGAGWNKERRMHEVMGILPRLQVKDLLTHRFSFSSAEDAYKLLVNQDEVSGLIALVPGE